MVDAFPPLFEESSHRGIRLGGLQELQLGGAASQECDPELHRFEFDGLAVAKAERANPEGDGGLEGSHRDPYVSEAEHAAHRNPHARCQSNAKSARPSTIRYQQKGSRPWRVRERRKGRREIAEMSAATPR